jgi:hypothetical protein
VNNVEHVLAVGLGTPRVLEREEFLYRVLREAESTDAVIAAMWAAAVTGRASGKLAGEIMEVRMEEVGRRDVMEAAMAALEGLGLGLDLPGLVAGAVG